ncbi:MAG: cobalamin-dependent protein [Acidimicrobiales bacterium]|nr:cobalamin-dependent protein [Acidimicrobiales bacterium]
MTSVDEGMVDRYLAAARAGDHRSATALVLELVDDGVPPDVIVDEVLVATQLEAGQRWWRNEWTVADEHLTTSTTTAVIEAISSASDTDSGSGHLVVVCAEGDWHGLPARMFSERMRFRGWRVSYLGASTPADHVGEFLGRSGHDALAVTCTLALMFVGAARLADVGHEAGLPVLIGGAAITPNPQRALELGADAAASSPEEADNRLRDVAGKPVVRPPTPLRRTALNLEADARSIARAAFADLEGVFPVMEGADERERRQRLDDLVQAVRYLAAAVLVDDRTVWLDFARWQHALLVARGVPEEAFEAADAILADHLRDPYPEAARLLTTEARRPSP